MKNLLLRSIDENIPVEMIYVSSKNQITQRRVVIKEMNHSYIRGYCYMRKQTRLFIIENILSVMPIKKKYDRCIG